MTRPPYSLITHCLTHFEVCHTHFEIQRLASLSYGEEPANKTTQNQPIDPCKQADFSPARELIKKHPLYWAIAYHAVPTPFHRLHARDSAVITHPFHTSMLPEKQAYWKQKKTPLSTHNTTIILFIFQKPPLGQHNFGFRCVSPSASPEFTRP